MYNTLKKAALLSLAAALVCVSASAAQAPSVNDAPLLPGDRVVVKIWLDTTFADTVRIDQTGFLTLPRVGPVPVSGLPASQVADSVRSAYSRVTRTLAIEVTPLRRVTVGGEVKDPGVYFLETHATLREAVTIAGGITDIGSTGRLLLIRGDREQRVTRWERRHDAEVLVHSSDVVWVGREPWLKRNVFSIVTGAGVLVSIILSLSSR